MLAGLLLLLVVAAPEPAAPPAAVKRISRLEAIQLGVARNHDLQAKRLDRQRLEVLGRAAWRPYSPTAFLDTGFDQSRPSGVTDRFVNYEAGVSWKSIIGTTVEAKGVVNQPVAFGPPDAGGPVPWGTELSLTVRQPLLKDGWLLGAALPLREAELQAQVQLQLFRGELNTLIANIETAYWDLALAEADVQIKTRSRDRAKQQFDDTAENIRRGIIADVEIYLVEENVVFFEQELLRTEQTLRLARRKLAELLALEPETLLDAEDELVRPGLTAPERQATVERGLSASPAVLAQQSRVELALARQGYASNQALPGLDLSASLGLFRHLPPPDARVGLALSVPLDRWAISASVQSARIEAERQQAELRSVHARVRYELENALTELELNLRLLSLATKRIELAELKLAAQSDKYKSGISTLADVVRFQRELDDALIASQRVIRAVHVGLAKLLSSQGTLAEAVGVERR